MKIIVAVKDLATEDFGTPIFMRHRNEAIRTFNDEVNNDQSPIAKHPADYELWYLGDYLEEGGKFVNQEKAERLARGADLKQGE